MSFEKSPLIDIAIRFVNNTGRHIFLTGKAGTGKTTFLRNIVRLTHKSAIVAAPTGIAAINAQGVTLHSLFQLPFGSFIPNDVPMTGRIDVELNTPSSLMNQFRMKRSKRQLIREMELLIIDEVSMLRADLLDAIDVILRSVRGRANMPFGGVQILFIGDLFQLPPVVKKKESFLLSTWYPNLFFFHAKALENHPPLYIELEKIYRQSDPVFISLLNHLRENRQTDEDIRILNRCYKPSFKPEDGDEYIFITTHNKTASEINRRSMNRIPGKSCYFEAEVEGDFARHLYPVDETLELKRGAQVMFVKNDYSGDYRYFNGKIGTVSKVNDKNIVVDFSEGDPPSTTVDPYTWENKQYFLNHETNEIEETIIGTFTQYPLKPAWAITVHKSQGLTFDKAVIDVSKAFAPGQIYVALSRLTSLDGLVMSAPIPKRMPPQDKSLFRFASLKMDLPGMEIELEGHTHLFIRESVQRAYDFQGLVKNVMGHVNSYDKDSEKSAKQQYVQWAVTLYNDTLPLKDVADRFVRQLAAITASAEQFDINYLQQRLQAAKQYFDPLLDQLMDRIVQQIKSLKSEKRVKTYQKELAALEQRYFKQKQRIYKAEALVSAVIQNTDLSREALIETGLYAKRQHGAGQDGESFRNESSKTREMIKRGTKDITLEMFEDGKSIGEIAEERSLAISTIEGHLAYFVRKKMIDADLLLDEDDLQEIIETYLDLGEPGLSILKQELDHQYSYGEIKIALAYLERFVK